MKKLLLIVAGVLVVLVAIVLILPFVVPVEAYKGQIEAQVERATGRNFEIRGPVELSILPSLAVEAGDVHLANLPGAAEADMASLRQLQVQLELWPLLTGTVEVARFVLVEPVIHLEVDEQGRPNWQFGEAAGEPAPGTEPEAPSEGEGAAVPIADLKLGDIRIENGTITYADAASGQSERLEAVNLAVDLPDIRSPLNAQGSLRYKEQPVQLQLAVQSPLSVIEGGSSPLTLTTDSDLLDLAFDGTVANGATPAAEGSVELDVASIRDLAAWLAEPIEFEGEGLRNLGIAGQLQASPERVAFTGATIALDDIEAEGEVSADLSGAVPRITGRLDVAALDLNPYLPAAAPEPAPSAEGPADAGAGAEPAGWSDEPIALPAIGGVEIDFDLSVGSLTYQELELGRTVLGLALQDNTFTADLREFALYGGQGSGSLQVALQDGTPVITEEFRLDGLQAMPFLRAAAGFERLEGTASAEIRTQTRGNTERQLVQNLNGNGNVTFQNGAIVGINIAAMVRNAATAFLNPEAGQTRKTDFAELGGSFNIQNGILTNNDMRLQAPVLRVNGSGRINLPKRTMNYRIEPVAAPTLEGQGGRQEVAGILVPVVIQGPWDDLEYKPDLSGVVQQALENPEQLKRQIEQLGGSAGQAGEALKELRKDPKKLLEGLTGGGSGDQGGSEEREDPAQQLLKGLFNR